MEIWRYGSAWLKQEWGWEQQSSEPDKTKSLSPEAAKRVMDGFHVVGNPETLEAIAESDEILNRPAQYESVADFFKVLESSIVTDLQSSAVIEFPEGKAIILSEQPLLGRKHEK